MTYCTSKNIRFNPVLCHQHPTKIKLFSVWNDWGDGLSIYRNFGEDINFTAPVWDKENQVYYRFAYFRKYKELDGKQEPAGAEVYLIVLDKGFQLLSETPMET
ncbi:MAG: DUF4221 domain-containing protein [Mongoliibacter sp.]|uniref:DUF4221 family protein n=1 Tax=Mongoliibacter sp. TaxID=2022438 RepID=UPI0012EF71E6|nr:MAG: DUF4221 domain-containing protein [Mongoliibacter sp.]